MYKHSKYESVDNVEQNDRLKEQIIELEESYTEKINLLRQIEELKAKNENLKQIEVNLEQKYVVTKKELKEYHENEVNHSKAQNEELRKEVASTEPSNVALDKKNKELGQELINVINKANSPKRQNLDRVL